MTRWQAPSASVANPDYWWYRARGWLLEAAFGHYVDDGAFVLDVGSADGASVDWMESRADRVPVDIDETALGGRGVCASLPRLPFPDETFDVVSAFDVLEHFSDEDEVIEEVRRVLKPGGVLLLAVPAYQWAWTNFDMAAGHYRRYTRRRVIRALTRGGFRVERCGYGFALTFPFFVGDRLAQRLRRETPTDARLPRLPGVLERALLALCRVEALLLPKVPMPFGSSVLAAARK